MNRKYIMAGIAMLFLLVIISSSVAAYVINK
ncbi:hypothetical protein HNR32_002465 [Pectinatus brassicae]|uniref:Uncharacterized protein n=1 Tax=Pectinatus brassicae TaxID=862415 RepID=A0A840UY48_9FIRM|nr:hypothetical protein [Pectinatus brassicae]